MEGMGIRLALAMIATAIAPCVAAQQPAAVPAESAPTQSE